jgi:GDP-D-mannose dehydratase
MSKALITGITGMVGSHLADYLIEHTDWEIYGVCRWRSPLDNVEHLLDRVNRKDRIYFVYGDLNDEMSLVKAVRDIRPDYVFHLAAQSYPQTSFTAPIDTLNTNILGTCRLMEAIHLEMKMISLIIRSFMYVQALKYLEGFHRRRNRKAGFTRNVLFILQVRMQSARSVQTFWGGTMRKLMV